MAQAGAAPAATRTPEEMRASFDARKGDFDYLLGDWEFTAENKDYGKLRGFWSAVKIREGQILDECRVVDGHVPPRGKPGQFQLCSQVIPFAPRSSRFASRKPAQ